MATVSRPVRLVLFVVVAAGLLSAACGGSSKASPPSASSSSTASGTPAGGRPTTPATLEIVDPTPDQVIPAGNYTAKFKLTGGTFAPETSTNISPDKGFIHVSVDDRQVAIVDTTDVPLYALTPGPHTVSGEYVASDHVPFANRAIATVAFTVQ